VRDAGVFIEWDVADAHYFVRPSANLENILLAVTLQGNYAHEI
jgi:hypothetical protein